MASSVATLDIGSFLPLPSILLSPSTFYSLFSLSTISAFWIECGSSFATLSRERAYYNDSSVNIGTSQVEISRSRYDYDKNCEGIRGHFEKSAIGTVVSTLFRECEACVIMLSWASCVCVTHIPTAIRVSSFNCERFKSSRTRSHLCVFSHPPD